MLRWSKATGECCPKGCGRSPASEVTPMSSRKWNWALWLGFVICLAAPLSFLLFFVNFPVTRDFPWVTLLLFGLAAVLLTVGLRRAYGQPSSYRGKIFGPILAILSIALCALFVFGIFVESRHLPASHGAPQVGQKAPDFELTDTSGKSVKLSELLTAPSTSAGVASSPGPKGVLLIFYRGYW